MKTTFKKQRGILCFVLSLLLLTACQNENTTSDSLDEVAIDDQLAQRSAEIDLIADDIDFIVEEGMIEDETYTSFLPDCVTITSVISQGFRERTVDFGTAGKHLPARVPLAFTCPFASDCVSIRCV